MTYAGAKGRTQEQMAQVLWFPTSKRAPWQKARARIQAADVAGGQFAQVFGKIVKDLNARGGRDKYELRVANALWGQQDYKFLAVVRQAGREPVRRRIWSRSISSRAAEQARQTINAWVAKQTNGKIKDLIGPGVLDAMTRLVLTNAIYFKGNWATQFKKDQTRDQPFTLLDGARSRSP